MRKPNRNLQYRDLAKKANLLHSFAPIEVGNQQQAQSQKPTDEPSSVSKEADLAYLRSTGSTTDRIFDITRTWIDFDWFSWLVGATPEYTDFEMYTVPIGQRLVIQQYLFWATVDNRPVVPYPVIAEPQELLNRAHFNLLFNDIPPIVSNFIVHRGPPPGFVPLRLDGFPIVSSDINGDSDPNSPGITLVARGGTRISFRFSIAHSGAATVMYRQMNGLGCRIRGFLGLEFNESDER